MWRSVLKPGELFDCNSFDPLADPSSSDPSSSDFSSADPAAAAGVDTLEMSMPSFSAVFYKALPYALLWGLGTALGELPPYAASYAAAVAHKSDEEFEELAGEVEEGISGGGGRGGGGNSGSSGIGSSGMNISTLLSYDQTPASAAQ
ncbi:hypothetical protein ACSSS7_006683 [Eimeria intestinalis]